MIDRYPHAPTCHAKPSAPGLLCTCGAGKLNAAFEAGKREADARAMAIVEAAIKLDSETTVCPLCSHIDNGDLSHPHVDTCPLVVQGFIDRDGERRG
jgi:hypothetical protein